MNTKFRNALPLVLAFAAATSATPTVDGDDFNDDKKDATRWGTDVRVGRGTLTERTSRLEYTVDSPRATDSSDRPWIHGRAPFTSDWSVQLDVRDAATPTNANQNSSFGIQLRSTKGDGNELGAELYASTLGGPPLRRGFHSDLSLAGNDVNSADTGDLGLMAGAVRIEFNATTKVLTVLYDTDPTDGYTWIPYATFGVAGSGGADGNVDWAMAATDAFTFTVYGYSTAMFVDPGLMWGDNFVTNGLVPNEAVGDFAVVAVAAPRLVTLTTKRPSVASKIRVTIQNRGGHVETIPSLDVLTNLVTVQLASVGACAAPTATLDPKSVRKFPVKLKPKQKLTVRFACTFDCANDPLRTTARNPGHSDFSVTARVDRTAIDGQPDMDPADDACPHLPPPGGVDMTAGTPIKDRGCGARLGKGFGADVLVDVVQK